MSATTARRQFVMATTPEPAPDVLGTLSYLDRCERLAEGMRSLAAHTRETALIRWDEREMALEEGEA